MHDSALGTLVLGSNQKGAFGDAVRPTLEVLARHVAVSLANARMVKRLEDLATTDGLTGLYNKRTVTELAKQRIRLGGHVSRNRSACWCVTSITSRRSTTPTVTTSGMSSSKLALQLTVLLSHETRHRRRGSLRRRGVRRGVRRDRRKRCRRASRRAHSRSELEGTSFHVKDGTLDRHVFSDRRRDVPARRHGLGNVVQSHRRGVLYASKRDGRNRMTLWNPKLRGVAA